MSRLEIPGPDKGQLVVEELYKDLERRIESSPPGLCPVDMTRAFIEMCQTQSCGKCTPCRVGLWQLKNLLTDVMNGTATMETLDLIDTLSVRDAVPATIHSLYLAFLSVLHMLISLDISH